MNLSLWDIGEERGAWHAAVHGVTKSRTELSVWTTKCTGHCVKRQRHSSEKHLKNPCPHRAYILIRKDKTHKMCTLNTILSAREENNAKPKRRRG